MSENAFKQSLARSTYKARTSAEAQSIVVRRMLNDLDAVLVKYWSALGDMGVEAAEFKRIRSIIKKRL